MKMVKYYVLAAVILGLLTFVIPIWWLDIPLWWGSASLMLVSFAYISNYPELFRKQQDGRIPWFVRWLFIPFLLGARLYNYFERKNDKVPNIQKIEDQLYLGTRLVSADVEHLKEQGIDCILDVTAEFDGLDWSAYRYDVDYLNIPVLDHASPTSEQLHLAINWLDQHLKDGRKALVHCALGRGRSVLVMAAYLLARDDALSIVDVMNKIQSIRATARLNKHQLKSLSTVKQNGRLKLNRQLAIVANPVAGGGKWPENREEILSYLNNHFRVTIYETTPNLNASYMAEQAIAAGDEVLIACGGDGTVSEVAETAIKYNKVLGVIPLGTANALSQVIYGMRSTLSPVTRACEIICQQHYRKVDTAICNDRLMLLVAAIGFESKMIEHADREEKDSGGQMAYLSGLWKAMNNNEPMQIKVTLDDDTSSLTTPSFVVANAAPLSTALAQGGNLPDMTDGELDVTWLNADDNEQPLFTVAELVFSNAESKRSSDKINHRKVKKVCVELDSETTYVIDGETYKGQSVSIETQPKSLLLLVDKERFSATQEIVQPN
ncbi:diacylglycerol kinase family protein [Alteromonas gilva]|uniref:Diacylglycerol kinase family protein n=1 Tax=Alteromonas gilva TaxID=2987522 RepID=A0ABT5L1J0_9ALTE|nr:diacylglycerol kinase family protein [Alteromonas gilva]MDC8830911.1 diacylglycerol kinase family protein [Alteromonas gilva]